MLPCGDGAWSAAPDLSSASAFPSHQADQDLVNYGGRVWPCSGAVGRYWYRPSRRPANCSPRSSAWGSARTRGGAGRAGGRTGFLPFLRATPSSRLVGPRAHRPPAAVFAAGRGLQAISAGPQVVGRMQQPGSALPGRWGRLRPARKGPTLPPIAESHPPPKPPPPPPRMARLQHDLAEMLPAGDARPDGRHGQHGSQQQPAAG